MSTTYTQYAAVLAAGDMLALGIATGTTAPVTDTDTAATAHANTRGDTADDTFSFGGSEYVFGGTININLVDGGTRRAFIGSLGGRDFIFAPSGVSLANAAGATLTPTPGTSEAGGGLSATHAIGGVTEGTLLQVPGGQCAVELLKVGDLVVSAEGKQMPVRRIGQSVVSRFVGDLISGLPIRICAGALDQNRPTRDLLLSPGHAVLLGDILADAGALVNGHSIIREYDAPPVFTYYHVELDTHAPLLAEGTPVESFLQADDDDTAMAHVTTRAAPRGVVEMPYPRARSQRQIPPALREQLACQAAELGRQYAEAA